MLKRSQHRWLALGGKRGKAAACHDKSTFCSPRTRRGFCGVGTMWSCLFARAVHKRSVSSQTLHKPEMDTTNVAQLFVQLLYTFAHKVGINYVTIIKSLPNMMCINSNKKRNVSENKMIPSLWATVCIHEVIHYMSL